MFTERQNGHITPKPGLAGGEVLQEEYGGMARVNLTWYFVLSYNTVCPRSLDPFYTITNDMILVKNFLDIKYLNNRYIEKTL